MDAGEAAIARTVPAEYAVDLAVFSATFTETEVGPGERPTLPDGSRGITERGAVEARDLGFGSPGIHVAARYGIYSSDYPARQVPGGRMEPLLQQRPVWLVTYFGPDFRFPTHGGPRAKARRREPGPEFKHVMNVLVDASTGEVLGMFG
jgi:hypothetical protein